MKYLTDSLLPGSPPIPLIFPPPPPPATTLKRHIFPWVLHSASFCFYIQIISGSSHPPSWLQIAREQMLNTCWLNEQIAKIPFFMVFQFNSMLSIVGEADKPTCVSQLYGELYFILFCFIFFWREELYFKYRHLSFSQISEIILRLIGKEKQKILTKRKKPNK